MKRLSYLAACGPLFVLLLCLAGCNKSAAPTGKKGEEQRSVKKSDQFQQAVEILQAATETAGYREALSIAGNDLARADLAKVRLSAEARDYMRSRLKIEDVDRADIEAMTFRPLDAHHVQQCFLLREVARAIERSGAGPLEQAQQALSWVDRHLLLLERSDDLIPPLFALQLGEGTANERALVFLALLDQLQIANCLVSLGSADDSAPGRLFAGVIAGEQDKKAVYLFDPRLGGPLPAGGGIATLADLRSNPRAYRMDGEGSKDPAEKPVLRVLLAVSMPALSPRMKYLEDRLAVHDRVILSAAPEQTHKVIAAAAGQEALPWISARSGRSPLRMLAAYLPASEGGHDPHGRHIRAESLPFPWMEIRKRYAALRLQNEFFPSKGQEMLFHLTKLLFTRYDREPRQALAGGQLDRAAKRLNWGRSALDDIEFAALSDADLQRQADKFRERAHDAYLTLARNQPGAQDRVNGLWSQDQYLGALLVAKDRPDPKAEKLELTYVMLSAVRAPLGERMLFLNALCDHDRAELSQAVAEAAHQAPRAGKTVAGKEAKGAKSRADRAAANWRIAIAGWQQYIERVPVVSATTQRLDQIRPITALELLAGQHQDLAGIVHRAASARLLLALAQFKVQDDALARRNLEMLRSDLTKLLETTWKKDLAVILEGVPASQPILSDIFKGLGANLGPGGGIYWLQKRVDHLLSAAALPSK